MKIYRGIILACMSALMFVGCGDQPIDKSYGRSRGESVNGTNALVEMVRERGHLTKVALRLNDQVRDWADVIVRVSPGTETIRTKEADWYESWMNSRRGRRLVYVVNDYNAELDYWDALLETTLTVSERARAQEKRDNAPTYIRTNFGPSTTTKKAAKKPSFNPSTVDDDPPADPKVWFALEDGIGLHKAKSLGGDWAEGVDPAKASIPIGKNIKIHQDNSDHLLLSADNKPFVVEWGDSSSGGSVLLLANGSLVLNASLLNKSRRPLTEHVLDWIDRGGKKAKVAFIEGGSVTSEPAKTRSFFDLVQIYPFNWICGHLVAIAVLAALAYSPRLGRAVDPPPSHDSERLAAHPEALGLLMSTSVPPKQARQILAEYRLWRQTKAKPRYTKEFDR